MTDVDNQNWDRDADGPQHFALRLPWLYPSTLAGSYLYDVCDVMSVVGKSTCSGFKTGLYIYYHGGNAVMYIKQRDYFLKDARISGYFDTKYMTVLRVEQILHNFEDQKFANFLNLEQVNFRMTLVMYVWYKINMY